LVTIRSTCSPSPSMQPRRNRRSIWLLLAWFVLPLGVAMASPVLQDRSAHHDCPEMAEAEDGPSHEGHGSARPASGHLHHCVLCGLLGGPPVEFEFIAHQVPAAAPVLAFATVLVAHTAAPLAARGPPLP